MWIYEPAGRAREYAVLALNIYRGCDHGCKYCYAPDIAKLSRAEYAANVTPRGSLRDIELEARKLSITGNKAPILLCFTTDAYCPGARKHEGWTRAVISAIKRGGQNVTILSKAGVASIADMDLLGEGDEVATTLTLFDVSEWEPQAATTNDRLEALCRAHERGLTTWASFEPVIDPAQSLDLLEIAAPYLDKAKIGIINYSELTRSTDWAAFGRKAETLCQSLGLDYLLKHDLRTAMEKAESGRVDARRT